jgi:hypothetical protein
MKDQLFKNDAKQIVDMIFDNKMFKDNITRDDMNGFEDLISFLIQTRFESHIRCENMLRKIKEVEK